MHTSNALDPSLRRRTSQRLHWVPWLLGVLAPIALGCSSESLTEPGIFDAGNLPEKDLPPFDPNPRQVIDPFAGACAVQTFQPERSPLDLLFMIDTSGSMADFVSPGLTKWDAVRSALEGFLQASQSAGVSAAISFFPQVEPGIPSSCSSDSQCGAFGPCSFFHACARSPLLVACRTDSDCAGTGPCTAVGSCGGSNGFCAPIGGACGQSADRCVALPGRCAEREVCAASRYAASISPLAELPFGARSLIAKMADRLPEGSTPTGPALEGALEHARLLSSMRPDRRTAVVLVTDGLPTQCAPLTIEGVAAVAAQARSNSPSITTFVMGVFAPDEAAVANQNLGRLAAAGGTPKPFVISTAGNVSGDFLSALNDIRATALACEYKIPEAHRGQLDLEKVNLGLLTTGNLYKTIGHVGSAQACDSVKGGWYYQAGGTPSGPVTLQVCPATCESFKRDPRGRVDVVVGCRTIPVL